MTSILIAEDHKMLSDSIKTMLEKQYHIVDQVFVGSDVIIAALKHKPDIILLDINLPVLNGMEVAKQIKAIVPQVKIVFLSMYAEENFIKFARELNVSGYLLKDSGIEEILKALEKIENGEIYYDSKLLEKETNLHHNDFFIKQFSLSKREVEVISLINKGLNTDQIAKKMKVSYETVKSHRKNIFFKLGFNKSTELIQFAVEYRI